MEKFYGQFSPSVDKFIFERYFPDKNIKGTFVECGAFDGLTECSCKFFEESMGWSGYNFEPVPWVYEKLCKNRPLSKNLNFALSNTIGDAIFHAVDHPHFGVDCTNGSLNHTQKHSIILNEMGCKIIDVNVKLRTWSDFIEKEGIARVDLLVLDVEGHELSVLEGMKGCNVLPDIVCVEVGHLDFILVREALEMLGYIYDISSHVNAYFVKLEKLSLFALRHSAAINAAEGNNGINKASDLQIENEMLRKHILCLENLLTEIKTSKAWKIAQALRSIRFAGKQSQTP